eukprot:TRINITY_DN42_c2_g2_i1.p1 TRINITY_DN42_c2_g2~~TRINITY_DN42_c2_g2_i1.p1  ORF type:complete len:716 (+),score=251.19 TRINITY_DN42_c2_g2_i1:62-2209(+)
MSSSQLLAKYAVVTCDTHGTILSANQNITKVFGYSVGELIGENVSILMPSPYKEQHDSYISRYQKTQKARVLGKSREVIGKHKKGFSIKLNLSLSQAEGQKGVMFIAMFEKSKDQSATFWINEEGIIQKIKGNYYYLTGYTKEDLLSNNINLIMPEPYKELHNSFIEKYLETGVKKVLGRERNLQAKHKLRQEPFSINLHVSEEIKEIEIDGKFVEKRFFKGVISPVDDLEAIITINSQGIIEAATDDFLYLFGYKNDELVDNPISKIVKGNLSEIQNSIPSKKKKSSNNNNDDDDSDSLQIRRKVVGLHKDGSIFTVTIEIERFFEDVKNDDDEIEEISKFMCKLTRTGKKKKNKEIITEGQYMGHYTYGSTLGSGYFGKVRMAIHRLTEEKVAIKTLRKKQYESVNMEFPPREVKVLKALRHPYINQLYDTVALDDRVHLILEHVDGRELCEIVETTSHMPEDVCRHLFRQILLGVQYMHETGVVHRDLKLENIIVDKQGNAKIIDLGFGNFFIGENHLLKTFCGSPDYAAPELFLGKPYLGVQVDIWSLGVMLYAMLSGFLPFKNTNHLLCGHYVFPDVISPGARSLIEMILKTDPADRPSMEDIINHPWVSEGYSGPPVPIISNDLDIHPKLIEMISQLGLNPQSVKDSLSSKEYNEFTTTYFLLRKKFERKGKLHAVSSNKNNNNNEEKKQSKKRKKNQKKNSTEECAIL